MAKYTLMPKGWSPDQEIDQEEEVQKQQQYTLMPKGWSPNSEMVNQQPKEEQGGYLDYLKDIPRVAGQFAKGVANVPLQIGRYLHSLTPTPGLPPEHPALRGMTPEQIEQSEQVGRERVQESAAKGLEEIAPQPKTELGKQAGEAADTLGSILFPIPGLGASKAGHAAITAGAGQLAKWGAKKIGFGEGEADKFKLGTMLLFSLGGNARPVKEAQKLYTTAEELIPKTMTVSTAPIKNIIKDIEEKFTTHIMPELGSTKVINETLANLENLSSGSKIAARDLLAFKRKLPEAITAAGRHGKSAKNPFYDLSKKITEILRNSPEIPEQAREALKSADGLFSGYKDMTKAISTIKDYATKDAKFKLPSLAYFGVHFPGISKLVAGSAVTLTGARIVKEMATNPAIRKHYAKAAIYALRDAKGPLLKELQLLDKKTRKYTS